MKARHALASLAALAWAQAAAAQDASPPTVIVPDSGQLGLGTQVTRSGNLTRIDGGRVAGQNLFHSFNRFDLGRGDTAAWVRGAGDGAAIANVVSRVTGGDPSDIHGTIDSTALPNASFFFINPAGIVFGSGAQLNVPAAAHFATAQELRFASGPAFTMSTPSGSTFSVAAPSAFGFVGGAGPVAVAGVGRNFASPALSFTLAGSDVRITDSSFTAGGLSLVGAGSGSLGVGLDGASSGSLTGTVSLTDALLTTRASRPAGGAITVAAGTVSLAGSDLIARAGTDQPGGTVTLRARDISLQRESFAGSFTDSARSAGAVTAAANQLAIASGSRVYSASAGAGTSGQVDVTAASLLLDGGSITSNVTGAGDSGGVQVSAGSVSLNSGAIAADALSAATGDAGNVIVSADRVDLANGSFISSDIQGAGDGGIVVVTTAALALAGQSFVSADALPGSSGAGGVVGIRAGSVSLSEDSFVSADTQGSGDAGGVDIEVATLLLDSGASVTSGALPGSTGNGGVVGVRADDITLLGGSRLSTSTGGAGDAGGLIIASRNLRLDGESFIVSQALASSTGGNAGLVNIETTSLAVLGGSEIASSTFSSGDAGFLNVTAGSLLIAEGAFVGSNANRGSTGAGGLVMLDVGALSLAGGARLSSSTFGPGDAGGLLIAADEVRLANGSAIVSQSLEGARGAAGLITIETGLLEVLGDSEVATSTFSSGDAGILEITAREMAVAGGSFVGSNANRGSTGNAGLVTLDLGSLRMTDRARLSSSTFGRGDAGGLLIRADAIRLDGESFLVSQANDGSTGQAGFLTIATGLLDLQNGSEVATSTFASGNAGVLSVEADVTRIGLGSFFGSNANDGSTGNAGLVILQTGQLEVIDGGRIATSTFGSGTGGNIEITARDINLVTAFIGSIARTGSTGRAGFVSVAADNLVMSNGSEIASDTFSSGDAGDVVVTATSLTMRTDSFISSDTLGTGDGGTVEVVAGDLVLVNGANISARSIAFCFEANCPRSGDGGSVSVTAQSLLVSSGGFITSDTFTDGDAGGVVIDARNLVVEDGGSISSESVACDDGSCIATGNAGAVFISAGTAVVRNEGRISSETAGSGDAGLVFIEADSLTVEDFAEVSSSTDRSGRAGAVQLAVGNLTVSEHGSISSATSGSGDAGEVVVTGAQSVLVEANGRIESNSSGTGAAGNIGIQSQSLRIDGRGSVASNAGVSARTAGLVVIEAANVDLAGDGSISTSTRGPGPAGQIAIATGGLTLDSGARIVSNTGGDCGNARCGPTTGDAGQIGIAATGTVRLSRGAEIASNGLTGSGDAGQVDISANRIEVAGGRISTGTGAESTGGTGLVRLRADTIAVAGTSSIESISRNTNQAGQVELTASQIAVTGERARVSSANEAAAPGAAGQVVIGAGNVALRDGAQVTTSSRAGPAGDISIGLPTDGFLILDSLGLPSLITTSSGPGSGGQIRIADAFAIVSNGGRILALGQAGGANVRIATRYFITSSDRTNQVAVDGNFLLEAAAYDVSSGTVTRDLSVLDASGVLRGQCASARATGAVSQLVVRPVGPYGQPATSPPPPRADTIASLIDSGRSCS